MPAFLEEALAKSARKHGFTGKRAKHYIFGAMNNMGAVRGNKITPKGEEMERKHQATLQSMAHARKR